MIVRAMTLVGGVSGAAGLSQFPEFSQQYTQRLGGAADEMHIIVSQYERDAAQAGASLPVYIKALSQEGPLSLTQAGNMQTHLDRYTYLTQAQAHLDGAGPFMRARHAAFLGDKDVAKQTLASFQPAIPASFEGAAFAGTGFIGGWLTLSLFLGALSWIAARFTGMLRRQPA